MLLPHRPSKNLHSAAVGPRASAEELADVHVVLVPSTEPDEPPAVGRAIKTGRAAALNPRMPEGA